MHAVGEQLPDVDLRSDARAQHAKALQIADEKRTGHEHQFRTRARDVLQERREQAEHRRPRARRDTQQCEIAARFGTRRARLRHARPERETARQRAEQGAPRQSVRDVLE
jgi:hypothetical protein